MHHQIETMVEFLTHETPDVIPSEMLGANTINSLSSVNQTSSPPKHGSIAALLTAPVEMSKLDVTTHFMTSQFSHD